MLPEPPISTISDVNPSIAPTDAATVVRVSDASSAHSSHDSGSSSSSSKKGRRRRSLRNPCRDFTLQRWISFQDNLAVNYMRRGRRLHGLQFPLHPFQVSGWLALVGVALATFLVIIPALQPLLRQPLYAIVGGLYAIHIVAHLCALLVDPADPELLKYRKDRIVPEFDRTKHAHVIENGRCHLCNIKTTNQRTKHCSVCNKCVGLFDHHCKWWVCVCDMIYKWWWFTMHRWLLSPNRYGVPTRIAHFLIYLFSFSSLAF